MSEQTVAEDKSGGKSGSARRRRAVAVSLIVVVLGGGAWLWYGADVRYWFYPKNFGVIEEGRVYRSGLINCRLQRDTLQRHGIRVIVTMLADKPSDPDQAAEQEAARELGIEIRRFPMKGDGYNRDGDVVAPYVGAVAAICQARREGKPVLVHCSAGASRAGGVTATFRLLVQRKSPRDAHEEMLRYGYSPSRNPGLIRFLNRNMPEIARRLVERGAIESAPEPIPMLPSPDS